MHREGGCLCGAVRYEIDGEPAKNLNGSASVAICHCRACQRSAGAPLVAWAAFNKVHHCQMKALSPPSTFPHA